jgi:hypothetical protein
MDSRLDKRADRVAKQTFLIAVQNNQQYYKTANEAADDLHLKPQYCGLTVETLTKWAKEAGLPAAKRGRPKKEQDKKELLVI